MNVPGPLYGTRGMVVSGHPLATLAAWQTIDRGGSVVDAAISGAAVLAVALPNACTIGGDAFILIHHAPEAKTFGINASGPAPAATDPGMFAPQIPVKGPLSMTVPGLVGGWQAAHDRFGRLDWPSLFEAAIRLADDGVPMSRDLARAMRNSRDELAKDPGCRALFLDSKLAPAPGSKLRQPALARTLTEIANGGARAFYDGWPADSLGHAVSAVDGFLRATDLEGYEPEWVDPLEADYRGHTVRVMPPNSFGLFMLLQLRALAEIDLTRLESGSPERFRHLIAATRAAFAEGRRFVADPNFGAPDVSEALGAEMTKRLQGAVAAGGAALQMSNQGGTAVISVADPEGNGITLVQSVFTPFGSAVADAETGIVLNDRMIGFTMEPGHPNEVAPGKRPAHTLNPVMVMEGERLRFLLGTPGGPGQTVTLTQVLSNLVDLEMNISEAVHTPRWSQGRQGEPLVEADVPGDVVPTLEAAGIPVSTIEGGSPFFGSAEGIEIGSDGVLRGAVDHRREAFALGA